MDKIMLSVVPRSGVWHLQSSEFSFTEKYTEPNQFIDLKHDDLSHLASKFKDWFSKIKKNDVTEIWTSSFSVQDVGPMFQFKLNQHETRDLTTLINIANDVTDQSVIDLVEGDLPEKINHVQYEILCAQCAYGLLKDAAKNSFSQFESR